MNVTDSTADTNGSVGEGVFGIILAIWIIVSNATLIIGMLTEERRRRSTFCLHIVNLAVADLLVGIVVVPIMADYLLKTSWMLGEDICQFWVITDILLCTVSILALLMLNCDRFMFITCTRIFYNSNAKYVLCSLMIMIPWVVGIFLVLPLWIMGSKHISRHEDLCQLVLKQDYRVVSIFVSFFVPAFFAVAMNISIVLMFCALRKRLQAHLSVQFGNPRVQIISLCLISVVFIVMWAPFFVFLFLISLSKDYMPPKALLSFAIWLGYANSAVNPVLWLVYPLVRDVYRRLLCCCRNEKKNADTTDDEHKASMVESRDDDDDVGL
ncbi:5-hydroxytryptamine receptor-like [Gigantopelta aegis]|uniref:5-hydroxytryptamine receptor-like n=1 Tax=Gigantopelta aegis TaxID=1735272 RepID=UPI001B88BD51|nr:5-hydroxytryptamine receptor-like [Gigantopelta aegis]XP_041378140.1 5-hydroxytryptamine receptor-like [Gigantopelta aegis]